jgi:alpha-tubulin suppressor-like RCC1 family protein
VHLRVTGLAALALAWALTWTASAGATQPGTAYESAVSASGAVAYFPFGDTPGAEEIKDVIGSYTAENQGVTLGGEGPFAGSEAGLFAEGATSATGAKLPADPLAGANEFTAEAWVYCNKQPSRGEGIFALGSEFGVSSKDYMFLTPGAPGRTHRMTFEIQVPNGTKASVAASKLPKSKWEYVAVTETGLGTLTLYVNGKQVGQTTGASLSPASLENTSDDYLGKAPNEIRRSLAGSLSNVAFYRKALSGSEISEHFDITKKPVDSEAPAIRGTTEEGESLQTSSGAWVGVSPITYEYQWQRCSSPGECESIPGAIGSEHTVTSEDLGYALRVEVTAKNSYGEGKAFSAETGTFGTVAVAWGRNYPAAQLGAGYEDDYEVSPVPVLDLTSIRSMVAAGYDSYALLGDGTAVAWGSGKKGLLGDGSTEKSTSPVPVVEKTEWSETRTMTGVTAIDAAWGHALALVTNGEHEGEVMTWGASEFGERGNGEYMHNFEYKNIREHGQVEPRYEAVAGPRLEHVVAIAAGGMSDYALQKERDKTTLWAWGGNLHGRLGTGQESEAVICKGEGTASPCSPTPEEVDLGAAGLPPGVTVTSISAGRTATYAVLSDGRVLAWGENPHGELGDGTTENSDAPKYVCAVGAKMPCSEHEEYLAGVKSVAGGETFALALLDNGEVVGWGRNDAGQLGGDSSEECEDGLYACQLTPKRVGGLTGVTAISAGASFSLALVNDTEHAGEVYSFGDGERGQLGYPVGVSPEELCEGGEIDHKAEESIKRPCSTTPRAIPGLSDVGGIAAGTEKAGGAHSFAYLRSGSGPPPEFSVTPQVNALTVTWKLSSPNHEYKISWKQEPPSSDHNVAEAETWEEEQSEWGEAATVLRIEVKEDQKEAKAFEKDAKNEKRDGNLAAAEKLEDEAKRCENEAGTLKDIEEGDREEAKRAASEQKKYEKQATEEYPYSKTITVTEPTGPEEWSEKITEAPVVDEGKEVDTPLTAAPYKIVLVRVGAQQEDESATARIIATPAASASTISPASRSSSGSRGGRNP